MPALIGPRAICLETAGLSCAARPPAALGRTVQQPPKVLENRLWILVHVAPGVASELVPACPSLALALVILLPRMAGVVVAVAVELDREPVVGPATIDVPAVDAAVCLGQGKAGLSKAGNEGGLELAEAHGLVPPDDATQLPRPRPVVAACEHRLDLIWSRVKAHDGLVERTGEFVPVEDDSEVDEGSLDRGDRNPTPRGRVRQLSAANPVGD